MSLMSIGNLYNDLKGLEKNNSVFFNDVFEYHSKVNSATQQNPFDENAFFENKNYTKENVESYIKMFKTFIEKKHFISYEKIKNINSTKKVSYETIEDIIEVNTFTEDLLLDKNNFNEYIHKLKDSVFELLANSLKKDLSKYTDVKFDGTKENAIEIMDYLNFLYISKKTNMFDEETQRKILSEKEIESNKFNKDNKKAMKKIGNFEKKRLKKDREQVEDYISLGWNNPQISNMLGHYVGNDRTQYINVLSNHIPGVII